MANKKVLVVDDEPGIRDLFKEVLSRIGYQVEIAADGQAGLERARDASIDIAFLDIRMPGIDGVDTLVKLKEMRPDLKVAMMTGSSRNERIVKALELGAMVCLCKPFGVHDIISTMELMELDIAI